MRNNRIPILLVVLVLLLTGLFSWLSHHPNGVILRTAESWPGIGPYASAMRASWRPSEGAMSEQDEVFYLAADTELVLPPSPPWEGPPQYVWALPGAILRAAPSGKAEEIRRLDAITHLARLGQRGDWFRIWHQGQEGWVYLRDYSDDEPPLGNKTAPPMPLDPRPPDPKRLAEARRLLGDGAREIRVGDYRLFTDFDDPSYFQRLDTIVRQIEPLYQERYALRPKGKPLAAIVVFRNKSSFMALQSAEGLGGLPAAGHAARGLAALYLGERPRHEVTATVVHELTHLINRRALGPALPPWLDEGLCDDMANLKIDAEGRFHPSKLGGRRLNWGHRITTEGALAAVQVSAERASLGSLPEIEKLLSLDWDSFVRSSDHRLHYDLSALWVRYLLEGGYRPAFHGFLTGVSEGKSLLPSVLLEKLGVPWAEIQAGFHGWLAVRASEVRGMTERRTVTPPSSDGSQTAEIQ